MPTIVEAFDAIVEGGEHPEANLGNVAAALGYVVSDGLLETPADLAAYKAVIANTTEVGDDPPVYHGPDCDCDDCWEKREAAADEGEDEPV